MVAATVPKTAQIGVLPKSWHEAARVMVLETAVAIVSQHLGFGVFDVEPICKLYRGDCS
jgi:hypothetical protein